MTYQNIIVEKDEGIATITFNRPNVLNALNSELLQEFSLALDEIGEDENIRVLVLTGAGEKAFVAGADIKELATLNALKGKLFSQRGHAIINKLQQLPIPVIAAVNGFALGGGTEIALACDFIYASEKATFGQPEITLGLIPGFGGTQRLPRLIGSNLAKEYIFTGNMIPAQEAHRIGLVNRICSAEKLMEEVYQTAKTMAKKGRVSLRAAKQAINEGANADLTTACNIEIDAFSLCMASEDAKEGTAAFLEKRQPRFRGTMAG
ncbi:MAG: enoyl-CoA hydratase/isomerase family protein [Deltaproteobacteria bacterium]|nr:enoyl-CoA hydratase/isomerase family protein [Deltaproteobacteria bacterium]MBW2154360.1 enoyl-CoA hydratase/isomerase family protein [Deltaproteobacteria bacterium]